MCWGREEGTDIQTKGMKGHTNREGDMDISTRGKGHMDRGGPSRHKYIQGG